MVERKLRKNSKDENISNVAIDFDQLKNSPDKRKVSTYLPESTNLESYVKRRKRISGFAGKLLFKKKE